MLDYTMFNPNLILFNNDSELPLSTNYSIVREDKKKYAFFFNLIVLIALSYYAFSKSKSFLLFSLDGTYMMDLVRQNFQWGKSLSLGFTNNIFQSIGNVHFPLNSNLTPGYYFSALLNEGILNPVTSYLIFSIEIFTTIYIFSTTLNFKNLCALSASWLFVILAYPYLGAPQLYCYFGLVPHISTGIAETFIIMTLLFKMIEESKLYFWYALGILVLAIHMLISSPGLIILIVPLLIMFVLTCVISIKSKKQIIIYISTLGAIVGILACLGFIHYFVGLVTYTAVNFYPHDMLNLRTDWYNTSILFHRASANIISPILVIAGVSGAVIDCFNKNIFRKNMSIMFLIYVSLILSIGFCLMHTKGTWQGPVPLYFEIAIWPLYMIYTGNLLVNILENSYVIKGFTKAGLANNFFSEWFILPAIITTLILLLSFNKTYIYSNPYKYPPSETSITNILRNEIGLSPNSIFRGRVAKFNGLKLTKANWIDQFVLNIEQMSKIGNDLFLIGFTYFNIPCLFEYNPFITPAFYSVTKTFLSDGRDQQMRNVMVTRNPNDKILKLLGVKFIVTDFIINIDAKLRDTINENNSQAFLYELDNVNIGQYSPTQVLFIHNAKHTLNKMAHENFDPEKSVITHEPIDKKLVPATQSQMLIKKDGYIKISSQSTSTSMLVLPIEFSNCFVITNKKNNNFAKVLRVNLLQAAILFEDSLDLEIRYFIGPGHSASCRLSDLSQARSLEF